MPYRQRGVTCTAFAHHLCALFARHVRRICRTRVEHLHTVCTTLVNLHRICTALLAQGLHSTSVALAHHHSRINTAAPITSHFRQWRVTYTAQHSSNTTATAQEQQQHNKECQCVLLPDLMPGGVKKRVVWR